jgi:hypothetical protein
MVGTISIAHGSKRSYTHMVIQIARNNPVWVQFNTFTVLFAIS